MSENERQARLEEIVKTLREELAKLRDRVHAQAQVLFVLQNRNEAGLGREKNRTAVVVALIAASTSIAGAVASLLAR